jgi:alpha-glucosidase
VIEPLWWQWGTIYQIYPRSFQDTNGDGIGDLQGITQRLDYLEWLGVDAIWISPIYPSPMADFGYDVADYTGIHPMFGTLQDFDKLLADVHARGMRVILDLVPNHTSDQHPWFLESRSSRTSSKRDWYIWHPPGADGGPPNNWLSVFGGSGWTLDSITGEYYYHAFLAEQPDLNWRNPDVQRALLDVMRFWLNRGVDGFRVDVIWHLIKDAELRDNPENPDYRPGEEPPYHAVLPVYSTDQPEVHEIVRMMRAVTDEYDQRLIIGEVYLPVERLVMYYGEEGKGAHLPFNFQLIGAPWRARDIYAAVTSYEAALPAGAWPNWVLGNHDQSRVATRLGDAQARVAAMLLLTLRGTPTMYYGDELGMHDVVIPPHQYRDPQGKNIGVSRDPARTPMIWTSTPGAGFTNGDPWLPISYSDAAVDVQRGDPMSMLEYHRRLLALRRAEPVLQVGDYATVAGNDDAFAFARTLNERRLVVALNLSAQSTRLAPSMPIDGRIVLSTDGTRESEHVADEILLEANQGIVILIDA